ncbi:MAG: carbon storage regulator CsrA [Spirochaetales bacterium]|nr:carbon storage regulator CsrA [Leptospiraceae bacterium]MCP5482220.1 carbon storage regulator CsrA [Spirochaetales bacterium]MCP5484668.1 carbon storage regulator CsrA [Spirochaetales bacterium]
MLVLARRINESIMIGDDIEVVVVDMKGDQIKLGIRAPRHVSVHRSEVYREIQEQNRRAAESSPDALKNLDVLIQKKRARDDAQ